MGRIKESEIKILQPYKVGKLMTFWIIDLSPRVGPCSVKTTQQRSKRGRVLSLGTGEQNLSYSLNVVHGRAEERRDLV